jgi:tetratricopeptide (TPR) repeat protein
MAMTEIYERMARGREDNSYYEKALPLMQEQLSRYPDAYHFVEMGLLYLDMDRYQDAFVYFMKSVEQVPDNNKIIKFRTRREINIGLVIALGVLIIMTVNIVRGYTKPHLSVYEVQNGSAGSEVRTTAMILRPEKVVFTRQAGYLNFFYREGARVAKNAEVYSVNDSNDLQHYIDLNENSSVLSENDLARLKQNMRAFSSSYSDVSFSECYIVREEFLSDYLRYRDISMLDTLGTVQDIEKDFVTYQTDESGVITYYSDMYDGYTVDDITYVPDGLDEARISIAKDSVRNALANKYEVTPFKN